MTPYELDLMLHLYAKCNPPRNVPILQSTLDSFESAGLIAPEINSGTGWKVTERGAKFVQMLTETPLPVVTWIDPRGAA